MDVCIFALFNKHIALCARPKPFTNINSFNLQNNTMRQRFTDEAERSYRTTPRSQELQGRDFNPGSQLQSLCSCLIHATLHLFLCSRPATVFSRKRKNQDPCHNEQGPSMYGLPPSLLPHLLLFPLPAPWPHWSARYDVGTPVCTCSRASALTVSSVWNGLPPVIELAPSLH